MMIHIVKSVQSPAQMEQELDNAANRGWDLVQIIPLQMKGSSSGAWIVFKKGEAND